MKNYLKTLITILVVFGVSTSCFYETKNTTTEENVYKTINDIDETYEYVQYDKIGKSKFPKLNFKSNIAVRISGSYMMLLPNSLSTYKDILIPISLKSPKVINWDLLEVDSDHHIYLDPHTCTSFTNKTLCKDMEIKTVCANVKDDVQVLEDCDIIYTDFYPKTITGYVAMPEINFVINKETDINADFFQDPELKIETDNEIIFQYSIKNGGLLFVFDKSTEAFKFLRIFSNREIGSYRYISLEELKSE